MQHVASFKPLNPPYMVGCLGLPLQDIAMSICNKTTATMLMDEFADFSGITKTRLESNGTQPFQKFAQIFQKSVFQLLQ